MSNDPTRFGRRRLLKTTGLGLASGSVFGTGTGVARASEASKASVTFNDQSSDGNSITVAEATADVPANLAVFDVQGEARIEGPPIPLEAGETKHDINVELKPPLEESQQLEAVIHENNGPRIAADTAFVSIGGDEVESQGQGVSLVDADSDYGFNYPYYLYAPTVTSNEAGDPRPIMVQPVNTGSPSDDFSVHREAARKRITDRWTRRVADELTVPLLVPVFPRPVSDPVDASHNVHNLDTNTMRISEGPLERVDLQMKRMIEHARESLADDGYPVADEVLLNGFSASGIFVNRWSALHPEDVLSVSAGGTNGMAILPLTEAQGYTLNYKIGVADFDSLIGEPFDREAFTEIDQFLYLGQLDGNDTLPKRFADNWYGNQRQIALDVFGIDLQYDRFPYTQTVYEAAGASAYFKIYEGIGHNPIPAVEDIIEFHGRAMAGKDLSMFNEDLGTGGGSGAPPQAAFDYAPQSPRVEEAVTFDAGPSSTAAEELISFTWDFGDGSTAAGPNPTHRYADPGEYTVTLTVADSRGLTGTTESTIDVTQGDSGTEGSASDGSPKPSTEPSPQPSTQPPTKTSARTPGFGVLTALAGIGTAAGYRAYRSETEER